jgi:hypothetical protein
VQFASAFEADEQACRKAVVTWARSRGGYSALKTFDTTLSART